MANIGIDTTYVINNLDSENALMTTNQERLGWCVGLVFVWFGLLFKVSAFPFHIWTPDVYEGAPTPITAFFALVPKLAVFYVLLKWISGPFFGQADIWQPLLFVAAAGSIIVGSLGALAQRNLKRLLAYSTIGHVGYTLIGLACGTWEGMASSLFYIWVYSLISIGGFALILGCLRHTHSDPRVSAIPSDPCSSSEQPTVSNSWLFSKTSPSSRIWSNPAFPQGASLLYSERLQTPTSVNEPFYNGGISGPNRPPLLSSLSTHQHPHARFEQATNINPILERELSVSRFWAF
jgi:NADH:ubiquinone oxidoreductase subunit 2 (subunit N)